MRLQGRPRPGHEPRHSRSRRRITVRPRTRLPPGPPSAPPAALGQRAARLVRARAAGQAAEHGKAKSGTRPRPVRPGTRPSRQPPRAARTREAHRPEGPHPRRRRQVTLGLTRLLGGRRVTQGNHQPARPRRVPTRPRPRRRTAKSRKARRQRRKARHHRRALRTRGRRLRRHCLGQALQRPLLLRSRRRQTKSRPGPGRTSPGER
jgi:hypothetical protein